MKVDFPSLNFRTRDAGGDLRDAPLEGREGAFRRARGVTLFIHGFNTDAARAQAAYADLTKNLPAAQHDQIFHLFWRSLCHYRHPAAREIGGSAPHMLTPLPDDPLAPLDTQMCAKSELPSGRNATFQKKSRLPSRRNAILMFAHLQEWDSRGDETLVFKKKGWPESKLLPL